MLFFNFYTNRKFINTYLKFKEIAKSVYFEMFMMFVLVINSVVLIWSGLSDRDDIIAVLD